MNLCTVTYQGKSEPRHRGTKCERQAPHPGQRHLGQAEGGEVISWWTEEEKQAIRAARKK